MALKQLPNELLRRIFVWCLPQQPYIEPDRAEAPLLLMRICRHWRDLAIDTTELWSSLSAVEEEVAGVELDAMGQERMDGYELWLSRSGNRPLSLAAPFELDGHYRDEWLKIVLGHRARFQRLRVVDEEGLDHNVLLNGADRLRFLAVEARQDERQDLTVAYAHPFLHTLILDGLYARPATLPSSTWMNLTRLAVRLPSDESYAADGFLDLISRCVNLQRLIFGGLNTHGFNALPPPSSLTHLRSLTIIVDQSLDFDDPSHSILSLPALCSLQVQRRFQSDIEDELTETDDTITLISPKRLVCMRVESDLAFRLFDVCWMSITELEINFIGNLAIFPNVLEACPALETFTVTGRCSDDRCTWLSEPITHRLLSELYVTVHAPLGNLFCMTTFPALQRLCIICLDCGRHDDIQGFLTRSRCPLRGLMVHALSSQRVWTEEERDGLAVSTPTLTELDLWPVSL